VVRTSSEAANCSAIAANTTASTAFHHFRILFTEIGRQT